MSTAASEREWWHKALHNNESCQSCKVLLLRDHPADAGMTGPDMPRTAIALPHVGWHGRVKLTSACPVGEKRPASSVLSPATTVDSKPGKPGRTVLLRFQDGALYRVGCTI